MIIQFKVDNQKLEVLDTVFLADKSQNLITCQFDFNGNDWENKQRFALLRDNDCNAYQLHIPANNTIKIPSDIVQQEKFIISLFAEDQEETRITTNMVSFRLAASGYTTDIKDLEDIDENIWVQIFDGIDSKVDKIPGKGLSTEDFTTSEKNKLSGIENGANNYVHPNSHPATMITGLSKVATTGNYSDLKNKPSIPTKISDLTDDSNFVQKRSTQGFIKNDGSIAQTISVSEVIDEHSDDLENIGIGFSNAEQYQINRAIDLTCYSFNNRLDGIDETLDKKADITYVDNLIGEISEYVNR